MKKFFTFILLLSMTFTVHSQLKALVELNRKSTLSIFVETNRMNFCLVQQGDRLMHAPVTLSATTNKNGFVLDDSALDINVKGFKSENPIAEYEFYKLMKVEQYPRMKIEWLRFELGSERKEGLVCGTAVLNITITDVTRQYAFPVTICRTDGWIRVEGKKQFSIGDFGLSAPKNLLLGMVVVKEQIVVGMDFLCKLTNKEKQDWTLVETNR